MRFGQTGCGRNRSVQGWTAACRWNGGDAADMNFCVTDGPVYRLKSNNRGVRISRKDQAHGWGKSVGAGVVENAAWVNDQMGTEVSPLQDTTTFRAGLTASLRERLVPGVALIVAEDKVILTPEAERILRAGAPAGHEHPAQLQLAKLAAEARRAPDGRASTTLILKRPDGKPLHAIATAARLADSDKAVSVVLRDASTEAKLQQVLTQADRLAQVGTLSAGMAHEIRNALVACRTFVELLLEKHQDAELSELVRREIKRIDDIVTRMLKQSGPVSGRVGPVHIHEVIESSLRLLQPQFAAKAVSVQRSLEAAADLLNGDETDLQQALMNLLLNSLEALPFQGALTVQTAWRGGNGVPGEICITITDNGKGIPAENLERMFEPFFTTRPDGTGLGMAITQRIIEQHQGRITVESEVGKGTRVRLFLPA